jgi:serine/threonine protein kinase
MYPDGTRIDTEQIIGRGMDGVVVLCGNTVLKVPKLYGTYQDGVAKLNEDECLAPEDLENEKRVYARLEGTEGVAKCLGTSLNGIRLEYCSRGSLEQHIGTNPEPDLAQKVKWISEIVNAIAGCHERHVFVFDIALRNILLTEKWSIRIIDFANSVLLGLDVEVSEAEKDGCTVRLDLLHLGNVIYSVLTWQKFSVDCAMETEWPLRSELPGLEEVPYGHIIEKCWARQYVSARELQSDVRLAVRDCEADKSDHQHRGPRLHEKSQIES